MPILVKFMLRHALVGGAAALVFVALILALDIGGLASLMANSSSGLLAAALLTFFTALTFGGLQMGIAVMSLKEQPEHTDGGDDNAIDNDVMVPVPVRVSRRRR